jgi:hypothetical protein
VRRLCLLRGGGVGLVATGEHVMGSGVTAGRFVALDAVAARFEEAGQGFQGARGPLGAGRDGAVGAAGQFVGAFSDSCTGFLLSWGAVLEVCEESTGLAGQGVRAFREGLRSTDTGCGRGVMAL